MKLKDRKKARQLKWQKREKELDEQVEKALAEKQKIADLLFICPHCNCDDVVVDFVSDRDDYLCECPKCGECWSCSKEGLERLTRKQNRVLSKAKRYWQWHCGSKKQRLSIAMDYIGNVLGTLTWLAIIVLLSLSFRGVV